MDQLLNFENKTVLITGAAAGFGRGLAEAFALRGANLVLGDINQSGLEDLQNNLADKTAGRMVTMVSDVTSKTDCEAIVAKAVEEFGSLDIAINNAGASHPLCKMTNITEEALERSLSLNTKGVFFGMNAQVEQMQQQRSGLIINVSSMAGLGGAPLMAAYSAAKHAVIGLTKTAALEYAKAGIRVNAICPYAVRGTDIGDSMGDSMDAFVESCEQRNPMKRVGNVEEIVNAVVLLASPGNSFMNGQAIAIDGGVSAY